MSNFGFVLELYSVICRELIIFSAFAFLIGGIDEFIIDIIWLSRQFWRKIFIYQRFTPVTSATIGRALSPGLLAVFVPAWDESEVIAEMLSFAVSNFRCADYMIYVGCYPNDTKTVQIVRGLAHSSVRVVMCDHPGPTTKADCLNTIWREMIADEVLNRVRYKAIVLHDAEDMISADELMIFDRLIEESAMVQLPVIPMVDQKSRWIGGHYCDEFAEAHGKTLVVREFLGAAIPAAGVGCAIRRDVLERLATARNGYPFDDGSLTEDYEIGLRIRELGERTIFVRLPHRDEYGVVGTRAHFPATLDAAVRQKTRWIIGITLAGWDRLGWGIGFAEYWMRLRDRRAILAAVILTSAYLAVVMLGGLTVMAWLGGPRVAVTSERIEMLIAFNMLLLLWRMAMRSYFVTQLYGWREGVMSVPRTLVGNVIAIIAARRAVMQYWSIARGGHLTWDKTAHKFPTMRDLR